MANGGRCYEKPFCSSVDTALLKHNPKHLEEVQIEPTPIHTAPSSKR